jgi:hypothetical protein
MRAGIGLNIAVITAASAASWIFAAQPARAQAFAGALPFAASDGGSAADSSLFADGTRAINEARWSDAISIFARIADMKSEHADGALYWKAYAENKQGKTNDALSTCAALRAGYPKSSWLDECGALEIEIRSKTGQPVQPISEQTDDLKLLALNSLLQRDEGQARAEIQGILDDEDSSQKLKQGALYLLGQHYTGVAYAQIVRLSLVQGDVRIYRGRHDEKITGDTWEQAVADLPLETGYSLVTGNGRAEIELENASTIYLGENSVLVFNDLHTTDGVPYTQLALISGTVSLHVKPYVPGEVFVLKTPTDDDLMTDYPHVSYMRVTSYADATAFTPLENGTLRLPGMVQDAGRGQTLYYRGSRRIDPATGADLNAYAEWDKALNGGKPPAGQNEPADAQAFAAWDRWVAEHVASRGAAMTDMMKAAGLTTPLPGLADLADQGKFFDCAPYGTCWEPNAAVKADEQSSGRAPGLQPRFQPASLEIARPAPGRLNVAFGAQAPADNQTNPAALQLLEQEDFFPCSPDVVRYRAVRDPVTGQERITITPYGVDPFAYRFAVCHSGYWIRHHRHYVWVVGKRHHHEPVHWVRSGRNVAYVPIHPRDVKGQLPLNAKNGVFEVAKEKNGVSVERVEFDPNRQTELLNEPPKEFRTEYPRPLARAEEPRMEAHSVREAYAGRDVAAKMAAVPITFDHKSEVFMMARQEVHGGHSVTVNAPVGGRSGNLQAHSGSSGSSHGGSLASGGSHGSSSASSGGGFHGGSVSSSSSGSASSSSGSGGGGSHH